MLEIYRASAGAGKTHLLTGEYIKLLFRKDLLPENANHVTEFHEILAVTFTNKSTAEMKERILKELSLLSKNPQKSDYYNDVRIDGIGGILSDNEISEKAHHFLSEILNNYSDFAVSTIDSFFQKIVRSFARELNLQTNYEVELNAERVLDAAVSSFIEKLDHKQDKKMYEWMLMFSQKKIEEGSGWRLEKDLLNLVKSVMTKEQYRLQRNSIQRLTDDKDWLQNYSRTLKNIISDTIKKIRNLGNQGIAALQAANYDITNFRDKSKTKMRILMKWQQGEIIEPDDKLRTWAEDANEWYTQATANLLPQPQTEIILDVLSQALKMKDNGEFTAYYTAKVILDNIYQLGILADIDRIVNEICNTEGSMLLSSTTEMLNQLISVDDAPFVYEKTGTHIHSYMIDEFQDTSHMQWNNFKPLILNSLAEGRQNLIVGDVKQSIYRWRGSDWELLHSGLKNFAKGQSREDRDTLDTNYRSLPNIIHFNSDFFTYISQQLSKYYSDPDIEAIFSDVCQKVPKEKPDDDSGLVDIRFLKATEDKNFIGLAMEQLPLAVIQLEDKGFKAKDIAILCRTTKICKTVADTLLTFACKYKEETPEEERKYVFDIISSEALVLGGRRIIREIINILRYIQNPNSKILKAFISKDFLQFSNRPLYDMVEGVISLMNVENGDLAYIQAFRDYVLEFANSKKSDLMAFLEWWNTTGNEKCVSTPEQQNAIRIMTIHKSKGLGMPAVILPCVEGTTDITPKTGDVIWCEPKIEPFKQENLIVPVKCSNKLSQTIFADDFQKERRKTIIDNINTFYVAFTRAKEAMVIFTPAPSNKPNKGSIQFLLHNFIHSNKNIHDK